MQVFVIISLLLAVTAAKSVPRDPSLVSRYSSDTTSEQHTITIEKASSDVVQIRVEFSNFYVGEAGQRGSCNGGLTVLGHSNTNNVPSVICGRNNNQHLYLNFDGDNLIQLQFKDDNSVSPNVWDFTVFQISNLDADKAPEDCLQLYTSESYIVESFNFRQLFAIADPPVTYQLSNTDYYICVAPEDTSLSTIRWRRGDQTTNYYFILNSPTDGVQPGTVGTLTEAEFDDACNKTILGSDYVEIPDGTYLDAGNNVVTSQLFCGSGFPIYVDSTVKPFRFHVHTNRLEATTEGSIGFTLSYTLR